MRMKITDVKCHVLVADDVDCGLTSSAQDSFLVVVTTDEGIDGYGESDLNPWIGRACVEAPGTHTMGIGMRELLIGRDPQDIGLIWDDIYTYTAMNGRRGAVIHALGAVEMALWDIAGKAAGQPVWQLLGKKRDTPVIPYASLQPSGKTFETYRDALCASAEAAKNLGFQAVKAECTMSGPFAHDSMNEPFCRHTDLVAAVRDVLGPDIALLVDVQYIWRDAETAFATVRDWGEFDIYFLETPIWPDFLDEHARLAEQVPFPIASGEWLSTKWEFVDLIERGKVGVVQPDVGRVGGIREAQAVCEMAAVREIPVVPHCWKTGVSLSATAHLAFVTPGISFIEYLPPQLCIEKLRRELATEDLDFENGEILAPTKPGLGIEINWDAVNAYGQL